MLTEVEKKDLVFKYKSFWKIKDISNVYSISSTRVQQIIEDKIGKNEYILWKKIRKEHKHFEQKVSYHINYNKQTRG